MDTSRIGEPEHVSISAQVERELRDELLALAEIHDRSFSAELRRALRQYVLAARLAREGNQ